MWKLSANGLEGCGRGVAQHQVRIRKTQLPGLRDVVAIFTAFPFKVLLFKEGWRHKGQLWCPALPRDRWMSVGRLCHGLQDSVQTEVYILEKQVLTATESPDHSSFLPSHSQHAPVVSQDSSGRGWIPGDLPGQGAVTL